MAMDDARAATVSVDVVATEVPSLYILRGSSLRSPSVGDQFRRGCRHRRRHTRTHGIVEPELRPRPLGTALLHEEPVPRAAQLLGRWRVADRGDRDRGRGR